jgi:thiamine-phosphate pyrophosphorylase
MQFPGREPERRNRLLDRIADAARNRIDFVQLREKDLSSHDLEELGRQAVSRIRALSGNTRLLINSRTDVALAAGADGVHLRSRDVSPAEVRKIWTQVAGPGNAVIAISCHTRQEAVAAHQAGADFVVFSPVYEKKDSPNVPPAGLELLRLVCSTQIPVLALGGITPQNAALCLEAGAKGIAGIRLFQEGNLAARVAALRG